MKIMNKRGSEQIEHPQTIFYVVFVVVLTLFGMYMAFSFLGSVNIAFDFQDYGARLNTVTAKLFLTPECYALEQDYDKLGKHYQVRGGIVDWSRFSSQKQVSGECLSSKSQVWARLTELNDKYASAVWSCPAGQQTCSEPPASDLSDASKWRPAARSFLVLVKKDGGFDLGIVTVRLKE